MEDGWDGNVENGDVDDAQNANEEDAEDDVEDDADGGDVGDAEEGVKEDGDAENQSASLLYHLVGIKHAWASRELKNYYVFPSMFFIFSHKCSFSIVNTLLKR